MNYERMLSESKHIQRQISQIRKQLADLPPGTFICARNQKRYKWFQSDGKTKVYIPKKDLFLDQQLATKKYLTLKLKDPLREKRTVDAYLKHYSAPANMADRLLLNSSEYQRLLKSYFTPLSRELSEWAAASYENNPFHPEQLLHKTISGYFVKRIISRFSFFPHIPPFSFFHVPLFPCPLTYGKIKARKSLYLPYQKRRNGASYETRTLSL